MNVNVETVHRESCQDKIRDSISPKQTPTCHKENVIQIKYVCVHAFEFIYDMC